MSERYVKEILEKLEEIEKLHAKLRSLVPRVKNNEPENVPENVRKSSRSAKNKQSEEKINSPAQKPSGDVSNDSEKYRNFIRDSKTKIKGFFESPKPRASRIFSTKYFEKLRRPSIGDKWQKFRRNSTDFLNKQWKDKNDKIKNFLSTIRESDIILVNRAAQTSDSERPRTIVRKQSAAGYPGAEFSSRKSELPARRRSTMQDLLERLLENFNYSREPDLVNEKRVEAHDHGLGDDEPRRVLKTTSFPDEETETLKIISSAERVSLDGNRRSSSSNRIPKLTKKRRLSHLS